MASARRSGISALRPDKLRELVEEDSHTDEDVAQELALAESEWKEGRGTDLDAISAIHRGNRTDLQVV